MQFSRDGLPGVRLHMGYNWEELYKMNAELPYDALEDGRAGEGVSKETLIDAIESGPDLCL